MRSTIICVDDEKMLLNILAEQLYNSFGSNYAIEKASGGQEALVILDECVTKNMDVSLVISDYIMPGMRGDELLSRVKDIDLRIRKVMLTGYSAVDGIVNAINKAGIYRYITKPWDAKDLVLTVAEAIKSYENEKRNTELLQKFETMYHKYEDLYNEYSSYYYHVIKSFVNALAMRDPKAANTSNEVAYYASLIGKEIKMSESNLKNLEYVSLLHNIYKLTLSDNELTSFSDMRLFNDKELSKKMSNATEAILDIGGADNVLKGLKHQYENYDGSGLYGVKGVQIPIESRILSLCRYFVVIKNSLTDGAAKVEKILPLLEEGRGSRFDPIMLSVFTRILKSTDTV